MRLPWPQVPRGGPGLPAPVRRQAAEHWRLQARRPIRLWALCAVRRVWLRQHTRQRWRPRHHIAAEQRPRFRAVPRGWHGCSHRPDGTGLRGGRRAGKQHGLQRRRPARRRQAAPVPEQLVCGLLLPVQRQRQLLFFHLDWPWGAAEAVPESLLPESIAGQGNEAPRPCLRQHGAGAAAQSAHVRGRRSL